MAKKQDKSNKTAHVLNLITTAAEKQAAAQRAAAAAENAAPTEAAEVAGVAEAAEAAEVNQQAAQVRQPLIPPILQVANHHDENLAEQINSALLQELDSDAAAGSQPASVPDSQPAQPEQEAPFKIPASAIVSSFTIPEPPPLPPIQEDLQYVNIMQKLVESMAPDYIASQGVCKCQRCLEDVKALALTNLGPKYTVFPASERIPMLTLYERRYSSLVATELTKACAVVKANPRHS